MNPNSNNNNKSTDELWDYLITTLKNMVEKIDQAKEKSDQSKKSN